MKYVLLALLCLVSSSAFASGKIIVGGTSYFLDGPHKVGPQIGFNLYQKLQDNVAFNSYTGWGRVEREHESVEWVNLSNMMEFYLGRFTFAVGHKLNWDPNADIVDQGVAGKISFKLWD